MTETLRASTDADFLALLPRIAGFRPRNSLVVALFRGTRTEAAFRIDLPARRRTADYRALAEFVIDTAHRIPGVDGVAPVVYTDETFAERHGVPWAELAQDLERRIERAGLRLVQLLCVAGDGWGSYGDPRPVERRESVEIDLSPLASDGVPELDEGDALPEPGPLELRAFDLSYEGLLRAGELPVPGPHLERCLDRAPDSRELAQLALLLHSPATRDALMMQAAFGTLVGEVVAERNATLAALQAERGRSMDEVVREEMAAGRLDPSDEIDGLLLGAGRVRPDPDRIERCRALLRDLVARLLGRERLNPLCMLIWLSWCLGHGSAAGRYLDLARAIDARHGMTELLGVLLDRIPYPEWALPQRDVLHD